MIECSSCLTWIHIKCADVNKNKIPDTWYCRKCERKPLQRLAEPEPNTNVMQTTKKRSSGGAKKDPFLRPFASSSSSSSDEPSSFRSPKKKFRKMS